MSSENLKSMAEAADLLKRTLFKLIVSGRDGQAEAIITAAGRMSGTMMARSFADRFAHLPPGSALASGEIDRHGTLLAETLFVTLRQLGHADIDASGLPAAVRTARPLSLSLTETQEILDPWFYRVKDLYAMSYQEIAGSAAMTTALLVNDCARVLHVRAGCATALHGMDEALRTVPLRHALPA